MTLNGPCVWDVGNGVIYIPCGRTESLEVQMRTGRYGAYALNGPWQGPRCFTHRWEGIGLVAGGYVRTEQPTSADEVGASRKRTEGAS